MSTVPCVARSEIDGVAVISPVGDFDIATLHLLRAAFDQAVGPATDRVVLDLSRTTFLDSMAIGVVIGLARRVEGQGGWLRLVAPRPNVRTVLRITGLDRAFGLYDTLDQALKHVDA
ncbi:MAG: STAS domain-containing protein [Marmoricola sp.]